MQATKRTVKRGVPLFLLAVGFAFTALICWSTAQAATQKPKRNYILIGIVNPTTGVIAGFGEPCPLVEEKAIATVNKQGGIYIAKYKRKLPVKIIVMDSQSTVRGASEAATKLILDKKVDLLIGQWTPLVVNPVAAVAERYKMPAACNGSPVQLFTGLGHHKWAFDTSISIPDIAKAYVYMWDTLHTNKIVGCMFDTEDGATMRPLIEKEARAQGYKIIDPGLIPVGTKDFSTVIQKFKQAHCDIITGNMNPPEFATAWHQFHQAGYVPKIVTVGKAYLFPRDVMALGDDLGVGLSSESWWSPTCPFKSSLDGKTTQGDLAAWWTKKTGKEPTAALAQDYMGIEIALNALKRAQSLNRNKLREALATTNFTCIMGPIRFNKENCAVNPTIGAQWVKGKRWPYKMVVVSNKEAPEFPVVKMIPIPNSK